MLQSPARFAGLLAGSFAHVPVRGVIPGSVEADGSLRGTRVKAFVVDRLRVLHVVCTRLRIVTHAGAMTDLEPPAAVAACEWSSCDFDTLGACPICAT